MELIERINNIDNEIKVLKGGIKSVLIDLREVMNTNENPFSHLKDLKGIKPIDDGRMADLEAAIEELKGKAYGSAQGENEDECESNNERVQNLENALESLLNEGIENKNLIDNLSESYESLKEQNDLNAEEIKSLKESIEALENLMNKELIETEESTTEDANVVPIDCVEGQKEYENDITTDDIVPEIDLEESNMDEERIKGIENSLEQLKELNIIVAQELKSLKESFGTRDEVNQESQECTNGSNKSIGNRITDMTTLTRITQWASRTINLIGIEKLNQIVDAHKLIGLLSENEHMIILKAAEIPDISLNPMRTQIETRHSIIALYELDCILNKTQNETFTLLHELIGHDKEVPLEDKNAILAASNSSIKL